MLPLTATAPGHAQGGSAIITLVMPPPGGEGLTGFESGSLFADGAAATYFNPALLSDLGRQTGSQLHYTNSRQDLLPVLNLKDVDHRFDALALALPDSLRGVDMGIGLFRNRVRFGTNYSQDDNGVVIDSVDSDETVYGAGIGIRLGGPAHLGAAIKFYDSRLADGLRNSDGSVIHARTQGWAFDLGMQVNPRLTTLPGGRAPWVEIMPVGAFVLQNIGPDAFYQEAGQADPIPLTWSFSFGVQGRFFDLAEIEAGKVLELEIASRDGWADFSRRSVERSGFSGRFLFYRFTRVWLDDKSGRRDEMQTGNSLELNMLSLYRIGQRLSRWDFHSPPEALEAGFPLHRTSALGIPFRANPRLNLGWRRIDSRDNGSRDGQKSFFLSLAL